MHGVGKLNTRPIEADLIVHGQPKTIKIWPVLDFVEGDIPFMEKLTNSIGHAAKHPCFRCGLNGMWQPVPRTVRC